MKDENRVKLRRIIRDEFENGINKKNLMIAIEEFIEENYREKPTITRHYVKQEQLDILAKEILDAGGFKQWKINLMREVRAGVVSDVLKAERGQRPQGLGPQE